MSDKSYAAAVTGLTGSSATVEGSGTVESAPSATNETDFFVNPDASLPAGPSGSFRQRRIPKPYSAEGILNRAIRKCKMNPIPRYQQKYFQWLELTGESLETGQTFPQRHRKKRKDTVIKGTPLLSPVPEVEDGNPDPLPPPPPPRVDSLAAPASHAQPPPTREDAEIAQLKQRVADLEAMLLQTMDIVRVLSGSVSPAQPPSQERRECGSQSALPTSTRSVQTEFTLEDPETQMEVVELGKGAGNEEQSMEVETEPEPGKTPGPCEAMETEEPILNFEELLAEFEQWIHMKTRGLKRDQAFVKMLPGLMQRWIKLKKLERTPVDFVDGLMKACYQKVKPSEEELELADIITVPDTRFDIERFNGAVGGDVKAVDRRVIKDWVNLKVTQVPYWVPCWTPTTLRMVIEKLMTFPWTRSWLASSGANVILFILLKGWKKKSIVVLINILLGLPAFIKFIRWLKFRREFLRGGYSKEGYFRQGGVVNCFQPGNSPSR